MWQHVLGGRWTDASRGPHAPLHVLIESSDPVAEVSDFSAFRRAGLDVAVCSGPERDATECPLVRGEPCPLAARADAVFVNLDPARDVTRRVLEDLASAHPDTPVVGAAAAMTVNEQVRVVRRAAIDGRRALSRVNQASGS